MTLILISAIKFQLTRLMRGVTVIVEEFVDFPEFQLTRLMRGVTQTSADNPS